MKNLIIVILIAGSLFSVLWSLAAVDCANNYMQTHYHESVPLLITICEFVVCFVTLMVGPVCMADCLHWIDATHQRPLESISIPFTTSFTDHAIALFVAKRNFFFALLLCIPVLFLLVVPIVWFVCFIIESIDNLESNLRGLL